MINATSTEAGTEIARATRRGRWLSAVLAMFAIALIPPFLLVVLPFLNSGFNPPPTPSEANLIKAILVSLAAMGVVSGILMIQTGRNILRSGQCPPPRAWVWRDTKIIRGPHAVRLAWTYILLATLCCVLCVGMTGYILVLLNHMTPQFNLPNDVKVIEYRSIPGKK